MVRCVPFVMALVTLGVTAGTHVPSSKKAGADKAEQGLRGRPTAPHRQVPLCNSIGYPNGYTLIKDAQNVECHGGKCEVSPCCEAFCSYHPCPDNFTPVYGAETIKFPDSGCITDLCCDNVQLRAASHQTDDHKQAPVCNSIGCPNGYTPISNAQNVECHSGKCEVSQCCDLFCNSLGCPNGYTPIDNAQNVECSNGKCEVSQCCDKASQQTDHPNKAPVCNSIGCPNGYTPISNAHNVECYGGKCRVSQCCEAFCSYHACPNNFVPVNGADAIKCPNSGCTTQLCCEDGRNY